MTILWRSAVTSLAVLASACAAATANGVSKTLPDAANAEASDPIAQKLESILGWSKPAAGSTSRSPLHEIVLHFSKPARLLEVTITGPDGTMPMMVSAAGEVEHYSLPLSGLGPGRYDLIWRAGTGGIEHSGRFGFEVK